MEQVTAPPAPQRPVRRSLPAQVAESITRAVLDGRFPPGATLPPERELAEQLGINRTSLRQAMARLEQAGLVEPRQGIGTVVLDPLGATDTAVVLQALLAGGPTIVDEVLEVRQALAGLAGGLAAARASGEARAELGQRFGAVARARTPSELQEAELAFFSSLVAATGNRPLQVMMRWLEDLYGATAPLFLPAFGDPGAVAAGLATVLHAVERGDRAAAQAAVEAYAAESGSRMSEAVAVGLGAAPEPPAAPGSLS